MATQKPRPSPVDPRLIIFDCDGVLFDSRRANQNFYNHLLSRFGKPPLDEADLDFVHTHTVMDCIDHLFPEEPLREAVQAYRLQVDYTPFIEFMDMEPGLPDFLKFVRPALKTAVNTNRTHTIHQVLKTFALEPYFDLVVSALDVENPKPHPESLFKILDHFGLKPRQGLFVGDSEIDAETASRGGVPLIAFKNPGLPAWLHVQSFDELREGLKKLLPRR
jgi:HAD superfamily hydrolase (TIGR01549 family)